MKMKVLGVRGSIGSVEEVMEKVRNFEDAHSSTVQIFRADRIFGELHLISAVERARRATAPNTWAPRYSSTALRSAR